jgi:hypothetical protein
VKSTISNRVACGHDDAGCDAPSGGTDHSSDARAPAGAARAIVVRSRQSVGEERIRLTIGVRGHP